MSDINLVGGVKEICLICLDNIDNSDNSLELEIGSLGNNCRCTKQMVYHKLCITSWYLSVGCSMCPICRSRCTIGGVREGYFVTNNMYGYDDLDEYHGLIIDDGICSSLKFIIIYIFVFIFVTWTSFMSMAY